MSIVLLLAYLKCFCGFRRYYSLLVFRSHMNRDYSLHACFLLRQSYSCLSEITSMSVAEKLQSIEVLWDALEDNDIELPKWHNDVLDERIHLLGVVKLSLLAWKSLSNKSFDGK